MQLIAVEADTMLEYESMFAASDPDLLAGK